MYHYQVCTLMVLLSGVKCHSQKQCEFHAASQVLKILAVYINGLYGAGDATNSLRTLYLRGCVWL